MLPHDVFNQKKKVRTEKSSYAPTLSLSKPNFSLFLKEVSSRQVNIWLAREKKTERDLRFRENRSVGEWKSQAVNVFIAAKIIMGKCFNSQMTCFTNNRVGCFKPFDYLMKFTEPTSTSWARSVYTGFPFVWAQIKPTSITVEGPN